MQPRYRKLSNKRFCSSQRLALGAYRGLEPGRSRRLETLEERTLLAANQLLFVPDAQCAESDPAGTSAPTCRPSTQLPGTIIDRNEVDLYWFDVSEPSRVTFTIKGSGLDGRIRLFALPDTVRFSNESLLAIDAADDEVELINELTNELQEGGFWVESDDSGSPDGLDPFLDVHLNPDPDSSPSRYLLAVSASPHASQDASSGDYTLMATSEPAKPPFRPIPVGLAPKGITTADFDHDGVLDLAVVNQVSDDLVILRGLRNGTFQPMETAIPVGEAPESLVAVQLNDDNHDGTINETDHLDLAVVSQIASEITILLGKGSFDDGVGFSEGDGPGSYVLETAAQDQSLAGVGPEAIAAVDLDGDQDQDLVVVNSVSQDVTVVWNNLDKAECGEDDAACEPAFAVEIGAKVLSDALTGLAARGMTLAQSGDLIILAVANEDSEKLEIRVSTSESRKAGSIFTLPSSNDGIISVATPYSVSHGDFNGDGEVDLVTVSDFSETMVNVMLGEGGGDFSAPYKTPLISAEDTENLTVGHFNHNEDDILDVIVSAEGRPGELIVLLGEDDGRGKGTGLFRERVRLAVAGDPQEIASGDFNDDGFLDLAVASRAADSVDILLGQGDGTFLQRGNPVGTDPEDIITADFNGDGRIDIATANAVSDTVSILFASGRNSFERAVNFEVGSGPWAIAVGDIDDDGQPEMIATANRFSNNVSVLWRDSDGFRETPLGKKTFQRWSVAPPAESSSAVSSNEPNLSMDHGEGPVDILIEDFNADGVLDIATRNILSNDISILFGKPGRDFEAAQAFAVGTAPYDLDQLLAPASLDPEPNNETGRFQPEYVVTTDLNRDGLLDLVASSLLVQEISVRLGKVPDSGSTDIFGAEWRFRAPAEDPRRLVAHDFDGDGHTDLAIVHTGEDKVSILWGGGPLGLFDTKRVPQVIEVGNDEVAALPNAIVMEDFDDDGDLDLAVTNGNNNTLQVLLWDGGSMVPEQDTVVVSEVDQLVIPVGREPADVVAISLNGDQLPDLAVLNRAEHSVSLLTNKDNGAFTEEKLSLSSDQPAAIGAGDVNGDGLDDLVLAQRHPPGVTVYLRQEDGSFFQPGPEFSVDLTVLPGKVHGLHVVDLDGDENHTLDLVVNLREGGAVAVLQGHGDGTFGKPLVIETLPTSVGSIDPLFLTLAELNHDDQLDIVTANRRFDNLTVILSSANGNVFDKGGLSVQGHYGLGTSQPARHTADLTGDDSEDSTIEATWDNEITVNRLAEGETDPLTPLPVGVPDPLGRGPLLGDLNGDGLADVVTMNRAGEIFVRIAESETGRFEPPQIVVDSLGPLIAQDVTLLTMNSTEGTRQSASRLAVLERGVSSAGSMSVYSLVFQGQIIERLQVEDTIELDVERARIEEADLELDGDSDLVVLKPDEGKVSIWRQEATGTFVEISDVPVGQGPWDALLLDAPPGELARIAVSNRQSGNVSLLSARDGPYVEDQRLLSGSVIYEAFADPLLNANVLRDEPAGLAAADINHDGHQDIVVSSARFSSASVLYAKGPDGFRDAAPLPVALPSSATEVLAVPRDQSDHAELLFLHPELNLISAWSLNELGWNDAGRIDAGNAPVSLTLGNLDRDPAADLLVGNQYGDVLLRRVPGDGPSEGDYVGRIDRTVSLGVSAEGIVVASRSQDGIAQATDGFSDHLETVASGAAPEMVRLIDVNGDGWEDLVVANSGSIEQQDILVYLAVAGGNGNYESTPRSYRTGTNSRSGVLASPVAVTAAFLNEDRFPDLVVTNHGSSTVATLFSMAVQGDWVGFEDPQLLAVGQKPVSSEVRDVTGDGIVDLLVTSSLNGQVELRAGSRNDGRVVFRGNAESILLGGLTREQGVVYGNDAGFVVLRDGSVASFALDDFQEPEEEASASSISRIQIDASRKIDEAVVVEAIDLLPGDTPVLFVAGFNESRQPGVSIWAPLRDQVFVEIPLSVPGSLFDPADMSLRQTAGGHFELLVGQDSIDQPSLIRIVSGTAGDLVRIITAQSAFLNLTASAALGVSGSLPLLVGAFLDPYPNLAREVSEISPPDLPSGSDDGEPGLFGAIVEAIKSVLEALDEAREGVFAALEDAYPSIAALAGDRPTSAGAPSVAWTTDAALAGVLRTTQVGDMALGVVGMAESAGSLWEGLNDNDRLRDLVESFDSPRGIPQPSPDIEPIADDERTPGEVPRVDESIGQAFFDLLSLFESIPQTMPPLASPEIPPLFEVILPAG